MRQSPTRRLSSGDWNSCSPNWTNCAAARNSPAAWRPPRSPAAKHLTRLRSRLARSNTAVGKGLLALLTRDKLDQDTWDEVEETLLASDLGVGPTQELIDALNAELRLAIGAAFAAVGYRNRRADRTRK